MARSLDTYDRRNRGLWIGLAAPGAIWLLVLFVAPFYVMPLVSMAEFVWRKLSNFG